MCALTSTSLREWPHVFVGCRRHVLVDAALHILVGARCRHRCLWAVCVLLVQVEIGFLFVMPESYLVALEMFVGLKAVARRDRRFVVVLFSYVQVSKV